MIMITSGCYDLLIWNSEYVPSFDVSRINEVPSLLESFFFISWPFLSSESDIVGSPFKRGEQHHHWWQWRVHFFQSRPRWGRGGLTGWKRGRNRQADHARGRGDTWTAEKFIISHICSLVFMEGSKLDICRTGEKINTIHWRVKTSIVFSMFLLFFFFLSDWNASYWRNSSAKSPNRRVSYCQVPKYFQIFERIRARHKSLFMLTIVSRPAPRR